MQNVKIVFFFFFFFFLLHFLAHFPLKKKKSWKLGLAHMVMPQIESIYLCTPVYEKTFFFFFLATVT